MSEHRGDAKAVDAADDSLYEISTIANTAHPVQWVGDPKTGKERPVDYDGLRSMCIRSLRERVAVTWQKGNAILLRAWPLICVKGQNPDAGRRKA